MSKYFKCFDFLAICSCQVCFQGKILKEEINAQLFKGKS